jgi:hypothetical protein
LWHRGRKESEGGENKEEKVVMVKLIAQKEKKKI